MQWNDVTDSDNPVPRPLRFTFAIFAITLSRLLYGYDRGAIGGASLGWYKHGILTNSQYSQLISLPIFVCVPGCLFGGFFQKKYGRKASIMISGLCYGFGLVICIESSFPTFIQLFLGRCISQFGFGIAHVTSLVYLTELTPAYLRGKVLVCNQMVKPFGNTIAGLVNLGVSRVMSSSDWRFMLGSCLIPCILQIILLLYTPRSFRWLYGKDLLANSRVEADKLYQNLSNAQFITLLDKDKDGAEEVQPQNKLPPNVVLRMGFIALFIIVVGQLSGFSAVLFYSLEIAHTSGIGNGEDSTAVFLVSEGVFLANFIGVLISLVVIERMGRRKLLLTSQIGSLLSIGLIVLAVFLVDSMAMKDNPWPGVVDPACLVTSCTPCIAQPGCGYCMFNTEIGSTGFCIDGNSSVSAMSRCEVSGGVYCAANCHSSNNWLLVTGMIMFVVYFSVGLAPIPFVLTAEIFPQYLRDLFTSVSISVYYGVTAVVTLAFGALYPLIGIKYVFIIFGAFTLIGLVFVFLMLPETKETSPEHMYKLFEKPYFYYFGNRRSGPNYTILAHANDEENSHNYDGNSIN